MVDVTSYKLPASNIWQFMSFHYAVSVSFQTKKQEKSWFLFISHMQCMPTQHDNTSFIFLIYNIYSKKTETQIMKSLPFLPFKKNAFCPVSTPLQKSKSRLSVQSHSKLITAEKENSGPTSPQWMNCGKMLADIHLTYLFGYDWCDTQLGNVGALIV